MYFCSPYCTTDTIPKQKKLFSVYYSIFRFTHSYSLHLVV